jgi:hypothetical protein
MPELRWRTKHEVARRDDPRPVWSRISKLTFAAFVIGAVVLAALVFAFTGPSGRTDAVSGALAAIASTGTALVAVYLSVQALRRTDDQLASAWRATVLSRYPLLLPVHQSVTFPDSVGTITDHPPTEERYRLDSPQLGSYAFVADTKDRFIIPVENAGEGPALRISGKLWRSDGARGEVVGPSVLGAGRLAVMTASLRDDGRAIPDAFGEAIRSHADTPGGTYYWLDLSYLDVFGNTLGACAMFDPRGLGAWHHTHGPQIEYVR